MRISAEQNGQVSGKSPVPARVRQQVLRAFVRRGLLEQGAADAMGGWDHGGGFSLDAAVRIEGADRAGRERLLRYCARPLLWRICRNTLPGICSSSVAVDRRRGLDRGRRSTKGRLPEGVPLVDAFRVKRAVG